MISVRQIDQSSLVAAIQQVTTGTAFASNLQGYVNAGGTLGPNVMYVSGLTQTVSGVKTFASSPGVPYSGGTGTAPSRKYVDDANLSTSGALAGQFVSSTLAQSVQGTKTFDVPIVVALPTATGHATNLLFIQRVSGALTGQAGGGISPTFSGYVESYFVHRLGTEAITGQKTFATEIRVPTPDGSNSSQAVNVTYLNTVSGVILGQAGGGNVGAFNPVYTSGDQIISGFKLFTGNPWVAAPTAPSGVVNLLYLSGVSGAITAGGTIVNNYFITGTGIVGMSSTGYVSNTVNVTSGTIYATSSGTVNNTFNGQTIVNPITINQPTGNFVNLSFYFDQYNLETGLNQVEAFVGRSFTFTGYGLGVINTGTQGFFSGSFYQRTPTNTKTNFVVFSLNSGMFWSGLGGFSQEISGMNRVGVDIYRIGTGITGLTVGLFGVGY